MTLFEIILVLIWLGVVFLWPSSKKTGKPSEKPMLILITALVVAALAFIF